MTSNIVRLTKALAPSYSVDREIGTGGMASVYLAEDIKHKRDVAVKVLHPSIAASLGVDRFVREIEISARLTHPHILMLIDSGEADGFLYYVMPFVDGESLRERISRESKLAIPDAVKITDQVASALTYAHERGVIHRDIKPENILLSGDQAVVADFGIARAVQVAGGEKLTETGIAVGTPTYMSPEQAFGESTIDGRSDVYALGCIVYEMVAGVVPFDGSTPQAILAKHAIDTPINIRTIDPEIPLYVERAVNKALAKKPEKRFETPNEFATTLTSETVVAQVGRKRVAVLPPANITGDPEQAFLVLGLHEALISQLGQGQVAVLARTSVMQYQGTEKPIREVCRELSVEAAVESSIFRAGDAIGIQARLIDGNTEEGLWSGSYEGQMSDVFALYRDISGSIAAEIHGTMKPADAESKKDRRKVDPAAYELYMRGLIHQQNFTPHDFDRAMHYYEAALAIDPDYAEAHTGVSLIWGSRVVLGLVPPLEGGPKWRAAAETAVALDPNLAEAHGSLAQDLTWAAWDWDSAETEFLRAIELNPNEPQARIFYCHFLAMMGRIQESDVQGQRALEIDPFNPFTLTLYATQRMLTGRYEEAIAEYEKAPPNPLASNGLAASNFKLGRMEEALGHVSQYFTMLGNSPLADVLTGPGEPTHRLHKVTDILAELSVTQYVKPILLTFLYDWAGNLDEASRWLERAYELRDHDIAYLATLAFTDEFRADPRFKEMLRRVNLPLPS